MGLGMRGGCTVFVFIFSSNCNNWFLQWPSSNFHVDIQAMRMHIPHTKDASGIAHSPKSLRYEYKRHLKERVIEMLILLAACVSDFITYAIIYLLVSESLVFFEFVSVWEFLADTQWTPLFENAHYGILPLVTVTAVSSVVALVL